MSMLQSSVATKLVTSVSILSLSMEQVCGPHAQKSGMSKDEGTRHAVSVAVIVFRLSKGGGELDGDAEHEGVVNSESEDDVGDSDSSGVEDGEREVGHSGLRCFWSTRRSKLVIVEFGSVVLDDVVEVDVVVVEVVVEEILDFLLL